MTENIVNTLATITETFDSLVAEADAVRIDAVNEANAQFASAEAEAKDNYNKALAKAAEDFFKADGTLDEFAEVYGKSAVTTRNHLKALDVDVPTGKKGARSKYSDDERREIAQAWKDAKGKARLQLAMDKDVTEATMRNWAIELGVYEPVKREAKADA